VPAGWDGSAAQRAAWLAALPRWVGAQRGPLPAAEAEALSRRLSAPSPVGKSIAEIVFRHTGQLPP
jgi:hypothetical protein